MSVHWLKFVPSDPEYQPSLEAAERARSLLAGSTLQADSVSFEFKDAVQSSIPAQTGRALSAPPAALGCDLRKGWVHI